MDGALENQNILEAKKHFKNGVQKDNGIPFDIYLLHFGKFRDIVSSKSASS